MRPESKLALAVLVALCAGLGTGTAKAEQPTLIIPEATDPYTFWRFMGFDKLRILRDHLKNKSGKFPSKEQKPPLLKLADPKNLLSDNPAIKKAAEIKAEEDLKPQKIKAIKYLARIGCGCYPGVKEALIAALTDCTEEVRFEAAKALRDAAGARCSTCNGSCCSEEVTKKLYELAYEKTDECCWVEPSARVREMARVALRGCSVPGYPQIEVSTPVTPIGPRPVEGPSEGPADMPPPPPVPPAAPEASNTKDRGWQQTREVPAEPVFDAVMVDDDAPPAPPKSLFVSLPNRSEKTLAVKEAIVTKELSEVDSATRLFQPESAAQEMEAPVIERSADIKQPAPRLLDPSSTQQPPVAKQGDIARINAKNGMIQVRFPQGSIPSVGTKLRVHHQFLFSKAVVGDLQVVSHQSGVAYARPIGKLKVNQVSPGDQLVVLKSTAPQVAAKAATEVAVNEAAPPTPRRAPRPESEVGEKLLPASIVDGQQQESGQVGPAIWGVDE